MSDTCTMKMSCPTCAARQSNVWRLTISLADRINSMGTSVPNPEASPAPCPACRTVLCLEPARLHGEAPCPYCSSPLFFLYLPGNVVRYYLATEIAPAARNRVIAFVQKWFHGTKAGSLASKAVLDSLDVMDLILDVEQSFGVVIT